MGLYVTAWALFSSIMFLRLAVPIHSALQLKQYGVFPVEEGDATMVFYANVSHTGVVGEEALAGTLEMKQCCLNLVQGATDCNAMKLISGLGYVFHPSEDRTLQMFFASPDLFDRKGFCSLRLMSKPAYLTSSAVPESGKHSLNEGAWEVGKEFNISFSTVLPEPNLFRKLMSKMISVGASTNGYKVCHSDNENAKHECANQDCQIRYSGMRSFFNPKTKECEPTPACEGSTKHLSPVTGSCETTINQNVRATYSGSMNSAEVPSLSAWSQDKTMPLIVCEQGDRVTGANGHPNCTCHSGWTTASHEEWEQTTLNDASHPTAAYTMCNVRATGGTGKVSAVPSAPDKTALPHSGWKSSSTTHFWLVVFILIVFLIPCTGILLYIHRSQGRHSESLKAYENLIGSPSASSSEDDEEKNTGKYKKKRRSSESEEEEDTNDIIAEIANRRESGYHTKRDDDDNNDKEPPPLTQNMAGSQTGVDEPSKSKSVTIADIEESQKSVFTPATSESNLPVVMDAAEPGAGSNDRLRLPQPRDKLFNPSSDIFRDLRNLNGAIPAARTPSTDELLDLNQNEKHRAHIPMAPVKSQTELPVVVNNNVAVEMDPKPTLSGKVSRAPSNKGSQSSSATEITEQKKAEWTQFMKSLAGEQIPFDENLNCVPPTKGGAANKVQSLPSMSTFSKTEHDLPKPSPSAFQKAFAKMRPDEIASRQEAYRLLSSLSNPTVMPSTDTPQMKCRPRPSQHSIWSNVASENAEPPEPETACASLVASMEDVRIKNIYGDLGSDGDSDQALEALAEGSTSKSKTKNIPETKEKLSVAEIFERNRLIYGFPQPKARSIADLTQERITSVRSQDLRMESDKTPSEVFPESTTASTTCSTSTTQMWRAGNSSSDTKLETNTGNSMPWMNTLVNNNAAPSPTTLSCDDGESSPLPQTFSRVGGNGNQTPETAAAYHIKTSIENALKASRSRSSTSFH